MPEEIVPDTDAIRFTYAWSTGGDFRLQRAVRVAMTALPGVVLDPSQGRLTGFWYELRHASGEPLWQLAGRNPFGGKIETIRGEGFAMVPSHRDTGVSVVVVPARPGGATVAVMSPPPGEPDGAATELLTHAYAEFP